MGGLSEKKTEGGVERDGVSGGGGGIMGTREMQ